MRYWIKRVAEVTVDDTNLSLRINQRSDKVQIKKIGSGRFRFDISMLQGLYLDFKWWETC